MFTLIKHACSGLLLSVCCLEFQISLFEVLCVVDDIFRNFVHSLAHLAIHTFSNPEMH